jgi:hypothetical protein
MFRGGFLWRFLAALLVLIALAGLGVGVYRMGFAQGYQTHALTSPAPAAGQGSGQSSGQGQVAPAPGYGPWAYGPGYGYGYRPHFGFFPFFPLFGLFWFLIIFFVIGGFVRFALFRRWAGGHRPGYWRYHEHEEDQKPEQKPDQQ